MTDLADAYPQHSTALNASTRFIVCRQGLLRTDARTFGEGFHRLSIDRHSGKLMRIFYQRAKAQLPEYRVLCVLLDKRRRSSKTYKPDEFAPIVAFVAWHST